MELSHSREFQFPVPTQLRLQSHFGESGNFSLDRAILGGSPAPAVAPSVLEPHAQLGEGRTGVGLGKVCCAAAIGTALAKGKWSGTSASGFTGEWWSSTTRCSGSPRSRLALLWAAAFYSPALVRHHPQSWSHGMMQRGAEKVCLGNKSSWEPIKMIS